MWAACTFGIILDRYEQKLISPATFVYTSNTKFSRNPSKRFEVQVQLDILGFLTMHLEEGEVAVGLNLLRRKVCGSCGGISPRFLNLGTRFRRVYFLYSPFHTQEDPLVFIGWAPEVFYCCRSSNPDFAVDSPSLYCLLYPSSPWHTYLTILILPSIFTKFPSSCQYIHLSQYTQILVSVSVLKERSVYVSCTFWQHVVWSLSSTSITCSSTYPAIFKPARTWMHA